MFVLIVGGEASGLSHREVSDNKSWFLLLIWLVSGFLPVVVFFIRCLLLVSVKYKTKLDRKIAPYHVNSDNPSLATEVVLKGS